MNVRMWMARSGAVLIVGAVLAGCGGMPSSDSSGNDESSTPAAVSESANDMGTQASGAGTEGELAELPLANRQIVSTATVTLEADDVAAAKARVLEASTSAGGVLFGETTEFGDAAQATITLKVPPERFQDVLADLASAGSVTNQQVDTEDVTEQVVDLEARIATARASVERLRGFLDRATNVVEIASLEGELVTRETELERLDGQRRTLAGQVELATITVTILMPAAVAAASDPPGFMDGLQGGWEAFVQVGTFVLAAVGASLPFLPFVVAVALVVRWARRRRALPPPPAATTF